MSIRFHGWVFSWISSALDKTDRAPSSFANTVMKLRSRTGRIDPALAAHAARCDASFVALYSNGEEPQSSGLSPGICRFFDTTQPPPRRGRPRVEDTITVTELTKNCRCSNIFANVEWGLSDELS